MTNELNHETSMTYEFDRDDLNNRFTYHPPKDGQPERYIAIRDSARVFAGLISGEVPNSREKSLALTKLEEAVMWANAGIARNE